MEPILKVASASGCQGAGRSTRSSRSSSSFAFVLFFHSFTSSERSEARPSAVEGASPVRQSRFDCASLRSLACLSLCSSRAAWAGSVIASFPLPTSLECTPPRAPTGSLWVGVIKSRGCPHRLVAQDVALSRPKPGFESPWGHLQPAPSESLSWGFSFEIPRIVRQRESFKASRPPSSPATFRLAHAWRKIPSLSTPSRFRWPRICQVPEGAPPGPDSLYCSYRSTRAEAVHTIGEGDSPPHVGSCRNDQAAEPMAQVAQSWAE